MASLSLFVYFSFCVSLAAAAPWIVTEYYEEIVTVEPAYTDYEYEYTYTYPPETLTGIQTLASPTGSPLSTAIITNSVDSEYGDDSQGYEYTVVQVLYPYQSAAAIPTTDVYGYEDSPYTSYVVALAYTAPTECSSSWTYTTAVPVYPAIAVKPTSVSTSFYTDNSVPFQPSTVTEVYAYVDPTQVPASSLSLLSESYSPYPSCYNPDPTASASSSSSSASSGSSSSSPYQGTYYCDEYDCSETSWINDSSDYGISPLAIILIIVLGWTFVIFVAGLFENYFHFQRLMKGWQARRGLPVSWWFWIFPVTWLVFLGFSRKGFQARTVEDAQVLREKWDEMGFWKKKGLWLRHGFGTGYPKMLLLGENGLAPPRVGRPSSSTKRLPVATQPLLQVSPPESAAPSEVRVGDARSVVGGVEQPEMSGVLPPLPTSSTLQIPSISVEQHAASTESGEAVAAEASTENAETQSEIHPRPSSEILPETRRDAQS